MIKRSAKVIHKLRVFFLFFISFGFLVLLGLNPLDVGKLVQGRITQAVGMTVGVPENKYNKVAAQLTEKESRLNEKEKELTVLEDKLLDSYRQNSQKKIMIFMALGIVALFVLVLVNFYLDYKRRRFELGIKNKK